MRLARDAEPHLAADFVVADDFTHARMKNLRAAAGQRIDTRLFKFEERVFDGKLGDAREIADLHHGERFDVHPVAALFEAADESEEMAEAQIPMHAADDVEF